MLFYKLASKNKSIQGRNLSKLQLCVMRIVLKMKITDIAANKSIFLPNIIERKYYTFISLYNTNHQSIIFSSNISMAIKSILIDFPVCGFGLSICLS